MKKIAVPSEDGIQMAHHFGGSPQFLVFHVADNQIIDKEIRVNAQSDSHHHSHQGNCQGHAHGEGHGHTHGHGHDHAALGEILHDCEIVICRGMGWRAAEALRAVGIEPILTQAELSAKDAVESFLAGSLPIGSGFCQCHH